MIYSREQRQLMIWQQTKQADTFEGVRLLLNLEAKRFCREILNKVSRDILFFRILAICLALILLILIILEL